MTFLSQFAEKSVLRIFEDLASPRSLSCYMLFKYGEWDQLASLEVDPGHYDSPFPFWRDSQATSLLRKCVDLPTTVDRKAKAVESFFACEAQCLKSNIRLFPLFDGASASPYPAGVSGFLSEARNIIRRILGPCPTLLEGRFGPGSTFGDKGLFCTIPDKMSSEPTFTPDAWPFLMQWSGTLWAKASGSLGRSLKSVPGNRFLTVPKDALKDRGIAVEPSVNVFYQLAYGRLIRKRLKHWGLDLNQGQDKHRRLACGASTEGTLATLDLSNASDTICRNLVKLLLPPSWFTWLEALRSKKTLVNGKWILLEKFSSMGNGFTFELETLIFAALTSVASGGLIGYDVFAYGDDLIFPASRSEDVISCLSFFGLTVNKRKSFVAGPFRESCGGDFFLGEDVRPFFLKESPHEPQHLIAFANGLFRAANNHPAKSFALHRGRLSILDGLPSFIRRCRGPQGLGDLVIHDDDMQVWRSRHRHGIRYIQVYRPIQRFVKWEGFADDVTLASRIYINQASSSQGISPRDQISGYRFGWAAYS